jgi:hypothetical protein
MVVVVVLVIVEEEEDVLRRMSVDSLLRIFSSHPSYLEFTTGVFGFPF